MPPKASPAGQKAKLSPALALLLVVLSLGTGYGLAAQIQWKGGYETGKKDGFDAGKAAAKADYAQRFASLYPAGPARHDLRGEVVDVGSDYIELTVPQLVQNPIEDPAPTARKVRITAQTKILLRKLRPAEDASKEQQAYMALMKKYNDDLARGVKNPAMPAPPAPFTETAASLSDIQKGMMVEVSATEDVTRSAEFAADRISAERMAGAVAPPMPPSTPPASTALPTAPLAP
ncbi:MAG: hypothetical protein RL272_320 [Candidatus Parcubacteria bacterium]|jgi:hypothetical protein